MPAILIITLGAALIFMVQPIVGRALLPSYGGTPAVWTTCLLFFQSALLAGYAWAHWAARRSAWVHGALVALACLSLPILVDSNPDVTRHPIGQILWTLSATVGLPYMVLAATAPWAQARVQATGQTEVHRLYAWSNAGSLAGLLAFPFLIEPLMGGRAQAWLWTAGFGVYAVSLGVFARSTRPAPPAEPTTTRAQPLRWMGYAACGSALLMAMTEVLCQDLSVTPLLWVLPLTAYLLSFILAFGSMRWSRRALVGPLFIAAILGVLVLLHLGYRAHWAVQLGGWCGAIFVCCMACHGALVRSRPAEDRLTGFYLWMALGGALGGIFVGVLAPLIFSMHLELHLALLAAWALWATEPRERQGFAAHDARRLAAWGLTVVVVAGLGHHAWRRHRGEATLYRSFFGVLQVKTYTTRKGTRVRHLLDGRISHGYQFLDERAAAPTAYFGPQTGIGQLLSAPGKDRQIGIIGLGVGTLAAYGRRGDIIVFSEINPDVITVAREHFSYLRDSAADVRVDLADGRKAIEAASDPFDILVLDAFSGDAIPTHLLTIEAFATYLERLAPQGRLAVNVSNRHADLARVVRGVAQAHGLAWHWRRAHARSPFGRYRSDWMVLARRPEDLAMIEAGTPSDTPPVVWTDDHAPLLPLMFGR